MTKRFLAAAAVAVAFAGPAMAAPLTFFGEDLNNSDTTPLASTPTASAAEASFLANLVGVGTEDFETFSTWTGVPLELTFPGAGTATLSNGGGYVETVTPGSTNGFGRYAVSGSNYWEVAAGGSGNFEVNFSEAVAAFGFYGVDIGDFGGQLRLDATLAGGGTETFTVPNTTGSSGSTDGSVLFFGVIDPDNEFTKIEFLTTTGSGDVFAFDDFTIGSREQVIDPGAVVPLPAAGWLLLGGFGCLGLMRRRQLSKA